MQVWFEVSAHTSRLHFHAAKDGSAPLGLSLPMGMLSGSDVSASLQDLLCALDTRWAPSSLRQQAIVQNLPVSCFCLYNMMQGYTRLQVKSDVGHPIRRCWYAIVQNPPVIRFWLCSMMQGYTRAHVESVLGHPIHTVLQTLLVKVTSPTHTLA